MQQQGMWVDAAAGRGSMGIRMDLRRHLPCANWQQVNNSRSALGCAQGRLARISASTGSWLSWGSFWCADRVALLVWSSSSPLCASGQCRWFASTFIVLQRLTGFGMGSPWLCIYVAIACVQAVLVTGYTCAGVAAGWINACQQCPSVYVCPGCNLHQSPSRQQGNARTAAASRPNTKIC